VTSGHRAVVTYRRAAKVNAGRRASQASAARHVLLTASPQAGPFEYEGRAAGRFGKLAGQPSQGLKMHPGGRRRVADIARLSRRRAGIHGCENERRIL